MLSVYSELLSPSEDISLESFSFKEVGQKILKFINKVIELIKRAIDKLKRFIGSLRDFKKEKEESWDRINKAEDAINAEEKRIRSEIDASYKKAKADHERKVSEGSKIFDSFVGHVHSLTRAAHVVDLQVALWQTYAKNTQKDIEKASSEDYYKYLAEQRNWERNSQFTDISLPDLPAFPEIESGAFDHTCEMLGYYLASREFFKAATEKQLHDLLGDLNKLLGGCEENKKSLEWFLIKANNQDLPKIQKVLSSVQSYIHRIALATQCIERALSLGRTIKPEYTLDIITQKSAINMDITMQKSDADRKIDAARHQHKKTFSGGKFSKEYQAYYNEKYPI